MSRSAEARIADVRRLLRGAQIVYDARARLVPAIAATTGLTLEGVELGFASLERDASDTELRSLVAAVEDAPCVHVVLSANVFVAPLRALALARAAAERVTIRPSPRDPVLTRALVEAAGDRGLSLVDEKDVAAVEAGEIHVYGRDSTIAAVRARARPGVTVRGHGAGMGVAIVSAAANLEAAAGALALDVVAFDQRGCLSPRVVLAMGECARGKAFAEALDCAISTLGTRIPRGQLLKDETAAASLWRDACAFAGCVWEGTDHVVAFGPEGTPLLVPPSGRHIVVVASSSVEAAAEALGPIAPFIVNVGTDDPRWLEGVAPALGRVSRLGRMQRPPLDGPVDRRSGRRMTPPVRRPAGGRPPRPRRAICP
jgi:hypothetical protein